MLDHGQFEHRQEVAGGFLQSRGDAAGVFEPADAAFDDVAAAVGVAIKAWGAARLAAVGLGFLGDHRADPMPLQPLSDAWDVVRLVAGDPFVDGSAADPSVGRCAPRQSSLQTPTIHGPAPV